MSSILNKIKSLAEDYFDDVLRIRKHLHQYPELSFEEFETSKFICKELDKIGVEYQVGMVKTGIVVLLYGNNPNSSVRMLRADMDALPILEENTCEYASCNSGVMHACGHDVHTASLLGAIRILHQLRNEWEGTIKCIFQPGEEKLPGGASLMIKEGVLENPTPTAVFGQHVFPELTAGKVGFRPGLYMASADELYFTVKGKGGHAATPYLNVDPILIASHIVIGLQQIVSRFGNPAIPSVLSIGDIHGNGATNVIPNEVKMKGTFRTMDEKWRFEAHDKIKELAQGIAKSMGGVCEVEVKVGYPFVINDVDLTLEAKEKAISYLGKTNVVDLPIRMTGEDFSYYSQAMPGVFYRLGTASEDGSNEVAVHNPKFDINQEALKTGMGLMAWLAV